MSSNILSWHPQSHKLERVRFEDDVERHTILSRRLAERLAGRRILPDLSEAA